MLDNFSSSGNARVTVNNYYCCDGRGCRRCRPSRPWFGYRWLVRFCLYALREMRGMRQTIRLQNQRIVALENQPVGLSYTQIIALIGQHAPACTHQCLPAPETRRRHPFTVALTLIGIVGGLIWTLADASGFAHTVIYDNTPAGFVVSSIADTLAFAWRFVVGGTVLAAVVCGAVGYVIDYIRDARIEVTR